MVVPPLPSSAVTVTVWVCGAPGTAASWRIWVVGVQVKVPGFCVSKTTLVSVEEKVSGSPSGSVTMSVRPVTTTAPVVGSGVPMVGFCAGSMTGAWLDGVSGMVTVTVRLCGFWPVNSARMLARPCRWGPVSEILTVNWSAAGEFWLRV